MTNTFEVFKDGDCWFLADHTTAGKSQNEITLLVPDTMETPFFNPEAGKVVASDVEFKGSRKLTLVAAKDSSGVVYATRTRIGAKDDWIGAYFWNFFQLAPKELYVAVEVGR